MFHRPYLNSRFPSPQIGVDNPFWGGRAMVEQASGFLVLAAALLGTVAVRGNIPPGDLKPIAILIS